MSKSKKKKKKYQIGILGGQSWHQHIIVINWKYGTSYLEFSTVLL